MQQKMQCAMQLDKVLSHLLRKIYHDFFNNLAIQEIPSPLHSEYPYENQGTARSNLSVANDTPDAKPLNNLNFIKIHEGGIQTDRESRDKSGNSTLRFGSFGDYGLRSSTRAASDSSRHRDGLASGMRTVRFYEDVKKITDADVEETELEMSPDLIEKEKRTKRRQVDFNQESPSRGARDDSFDYSPKRNYQTNLDLLEKKLEKLFESKIDDKIEENFDRKIGQNLEYYLIKLLSQGLGSLKPLLAQDQSITPSVEALNETHHKETQQQRAHSVDSPLNLNKEKTENSFMPINQNQTAAIAGVLQKDEFYPETYYQQGPETLLINLIKQQGEEGEIIPKRSSKVSSKVSSPKNQKLPTNIQFYSHTTYIKI